MPTVSVKVTDEDLEMLRRVKGKMGWKQFLYKASWLIGCTEREPFSQFDGEKWGVPEEIMLIEKPCYNTGYCPYGQLVEAFHIKNEPYTEFSCRMFGHDCPAFYCSEPFVEKPWVKPQIPDLEHIKEHS